MLTGAQLVRAARDACETALVRHGFRRLRKHEVAFEFTKEFLGWVGLNAGNYAACVRINPFVGIHSAPLMKLVADMRGEKYQLGRYATFAVHLGDICPQVDVFDFSSEADLAPQAERLAATIERYAVPYMQAHASYDALLPILKERVPMFGGYPERVAAALYLMGQRDEARQFVLDRQAGYEADAVLRDSFDRFALPFLKLLTH